jgi:hypothetical protein
MWYRMEVVELFELCRFSLTWLFYTLISCHFQSASRRQHENIKHHTSYFARSTVPGTRSKCWTTTTTHIRCASIVLTQLTRTLLSLL